MKRFISVLSLCFLLASVSLSQFGFGAKGGIDFATIGGADAISTSKTRTGFAVGAYAEFNIPFLLTIQPEVLYTTKGFELDGSILPDGPTSLIATNTYTYLEVPVLLKYVLPVPMVKPSLCVGPEVAFLLAARSKYKRIDGGTNDDDYKSRTTSTDVGAVFGASAHILFVDVDIRYDLGLKTTIKDGSGKVYNRVWSIMVGIPLY